MARAGKQPLAIDLFCGLGGWSEGLIAEGWRVIGYDIEAHEYGVQRYPGELVIQDVLTLHGSQFKDADLIVASPPCQEYSYMAMPWKRAKAKAAAIRADETGAELERLNQLFNACFRIQKEASIAAGRHIPLIVENVRGAIPWVGRSRYNFGSFHLWGDVPALMPAAVKAGVKAPGMNWSDQSNPNNRRSFTENGGMKNTGGSWFRPPEGRKCRPKNCPDGRKSGDAPWSDGVKMRDVDGYERDHPQAFGWKTPRTSSNSPKRKAASALIAKIPEPLARHIARTFKPEAIAA